MCRILVLFLGLCVVVPGYGQLPKDIWLMGYEEYPVPWYGHSRMEINKQGRKVEAASHGMNFDQTMAVWQDSSGSLRLYTNGCAVATGDGQILTDGLNPGTERDILCPTYGYTLEGGALFLDDPAGDGKVILVHHGQREDDKVIHVRDKLYLSRFQVNDSGTDVLSINELLVDAQMERFVAVRHGNGRDWWLLCPGLNTEKWYVILLHPEGYTVEIHETGVPPLNSKNCGRGMPSLAASPDGSLISRWNPNCGLRVYSWDRCEGQLEFLIETNAGMHKLAKWTVGSTVFSPSGRYIYTNNHVTVYRFDTWSSTPKLDTMFWAKNHWGMPLNQMAVAADGKIYISQIGSDTFMATIQLPDAGGQLPLFLPRGFSVGRLFRGTMPITINRTPGPMLGSACDSLMVQVEDPDGYGNAMTPFLELVPNPVIGDVYLRVSGEYVPRRYRIMDSSGAIMKEGPILPDSRLETAALPPGWYMVMINPGEDDMVVMKMIKME